MGGSEQGRAAQVAPQWAPGLRNAHAAHVGPGAGGFHSVLGPTVGREAGHGGSPLPATARIQPERPRPVSRSWLGHQEPPAAAHGPQARPAAYMFEQVWCPPHGKCPCRDSGFCPLQKGPKASLWAVRILPRVGRTPNPEGCVLVTIPGRTKGTKQSKERTGPVLPLGTSVTKAG